MRGHNCKRVSKGMEGVAADLLAMHLSIQILPLRENPISALMHTQKKTKLEAKNPPIFPVFLKKSFLMKVSFFRAVAPL